MNYADLTNLFNVALSPRGATRAESWFLVSTATWLHGNRNLPAPDENRIVAMKWCMCSMAGYADIEKRGLLRGFFSDLLKRQISYIRKELRA